MAIATGNKKRFNLTVIVILFLGLITFELLTPQIFLPKEKSINIDFEGHLRLHDEPDVFVNVSDVPQVRRFSLEVKETRWEVTPGQFFTAWTFNKTLPGPTIGVYAGDTVELMITNNLKESVNVEILTPSSADRLSSSLERTTTASSEIITFTVPQNGSGTWIYRDTIISRSVERGLYGAFIVYSRDRPLPDHDVVVFLDSFKPPITDNDDYFAVQNGGAYPFGPHYVFKEGELIRYRAINIDIGQDGADHTTHIHGHTWGDEANRTIDNELLSPGESIDRLIRAKNPGLWMYHCHIYDHIAAGMTGMLSIIPENYTGDPLDYLAILMEQTPLCGLPKSDSS